MSDECEIVSAALHSIRLMPRRSNAQQEADEMRLIASETLERLPSLRGATPFDDLRNQVERLQAKNLSLAKAANNLLRTVNEPHLVGALCDRALDDDSCITREDIVQLRDSINRMRSELKEV